MGFINFHLFSPLYEKMEGVDIRRAHQWEGSLYDHMPTDCRHTRHRCIFVIAKTKNKEPEISLLYLLYRLLFDVF